MYYRRLGQIDRAVTIANDAIDGFPESEAVDNLLFEKTSLHLVKGQPEEARVAAEALAEGYPESAFAPRGLQKVADYYFDLTGGQAVAQEIYTDILLRFPKAIEIPDVRARLDDLAGRGTDSSALQPGRSEIPRTPDRAVRPRPVCPRSVPHDIAKGGRLSWLG
jgi:hypothetical protein